MNICFTGHRPDKLFGYDIDNEKYHHLGEKITEEVLKIINGSSDKKFTFYFGGALGVDQLAFEWIRHIEKTIDWFISNKYLNRYVHIETIIAIPFEKQACKWQSKDADRWRKQLMSCDELIEVDNVEGYKFDKVKIGEYHPAKMQFRNMYMVDNSDLVIAIWDGSKGGTGNCVDYAKKKNKQILVIKLNSI